MLDDAPVRPNRLVLITPYDPNDVSVWSGTLRSIYLSLLEHKGKVIFKYAIGGLGIVESVARLINRAAKRFGFVGIDARFSTAYALLTGLYLTVRYSFARDCTFLIVAGSNYLPYFTTKRPIIYISDATFRAIGDLYPGFLAFPEWLRRQGDRNEAKSLSKAQFVIYPSQWASKSAQIDYGVSTDRIFKIPFGPNIPHQLIERYFAPKSLPLADGINFLFVSADWQRKNGDLATDICRHLINLGLRVRLTIIGKTPEYAKKLDFVDDRGFLSKSDPSQLIKLCEAFREAHFFLLPSMADASPIVFSEAQAFGVPSIAYDVGGVGSSILHKKTGLLLPLGASAELFSNEIYEYLRDPPRYYELSQNCRDRYLGESNWGRWAELILKLAQRSC